jgi:hypothetical protein
MLKRFSKSSVLIVKIAYDALVHNREQQSATGYLYLDTEDSTICLDSHCFITLLKR